MFSSPIVQMILAVVGAFLGFWLLFILLPHRVRMQRIGMKHGWLSQKHAAIEKLFLDGKLTGVAYVGASYDPRETFSLIITGPFGTFIRSGSKHNDLVTEPKSSELPPEIASAFSGYIDRPADVVELLGSLAFLERIEKVDDGKFKVGGDTQESLAIVNTHAFESLAGIA